MEIKPTNLFINDRIFAQVRTLAFKETSTENRFLTDSFKTHHKSIQFLLFFSIFIWLFFCYFHLSRILTILSLFIISFAAYLQSFLLTNLLLLIFSLVAKLLLVKTAGLMDCFGIFVPSIVFNTFFIKNWVFVLVFNVFEVFVLYWYKIMNLEYLLFSVFIVSVINSAIEKDFRDVWHIYSSYKKSSRIHQSLWANSFCANLLVNPEGNIVYSNLAAMKLAPNKVKPSKLLNLGKFEILFIEDRETCRKIIEKTLRGQIVQKQIIKKKPVLLLKNEEVKDLSYLITSVRVPWDQKDCIRITCIDNSFLMLKNIMILACLKDFAGSFFQFTKELSHNALSTKPIFREVLTNFFSISNFFTDILIMQSYFLYTIEPKKEVFDMHAEMLNTIEALYLKACRFDLTLFYTKEQGIPSSVIGDKRLVNSVIYNIMNMILENATKGSEVCILIQITVLFT